MRHFVEREDIAYGLYNLKCRDCDFRVERVHHRFVIDEGTEHRLTALEAELDCVTKERDEARLLVEQMKDREADALFDIEELERERDEARADAIRTTPLVTETK